MKNFDRTPVYDDEQAKYRLFVERLALTRSDLPILTKLNYWSDTTGECHCFPIFTTDKPIDIINRYCDAFPMEYQNLVDEVKQMNANLHNEDGMSKERTNMAKLRIPILVYRALAELDSNFWEGNKGIKWLENNVKPLRIGNVRN